MKVGDVCMYVCVSVSVRTYVCTYECIRVVMCRRVRDNEGTEKGTMKLQVEAGLYELRSSKCAAAGGSTDGARTLTALQLQDKSGTPESVRNCDASRIWEERTHGTVTAALSRRLEISSIWRTARFRVHTNTPDFEQVGTQHEHGIVANALDFTTTSVCGRTKPSSIENEHCATAGAAEPLCATTGRPSLFQ